MSSDQVLRLLISGELAVNRVAEAAFQRSPGLRRGLCLCQFARTPPLAANSITIALAVSARRDLLTAPNRHHRVRSSAEQAAPGRLRSASARRAQGKLAI